MRERRRLRPTSRQTTGAGCAQGRWGCSPTPIPALWGVGSVRLWGRGACPRAAGVAAMLALVMPVMHEHMHQWTGEQQQVRLDAKHVHRVFIDQEERRDHAKADERDSPRRR